ILAPAASTRSTAGPWTARRSAASISGSRPPRCATGSGFDQAQLTRDRLQRLDHVRDVLVELEAEQLGALRDLVAVDARGERRLLQLLAHRLRLHRLDPVGPHVAARRHEARELVAGEERPLQRRVPVDVEVLGVGEDRLDHPLGIPLLAQDRRPVLRMLVEGRMDLVVEVVQERDDAPALLVLAELTRVPARRGLDRQGVPDQRLALRVAGQSLPGAVAIQFQDRGYDSPRSEVDLSPPMSQAVVSSELMESFVIEGGRPLSGTV